MKPKLQPQKEVESVFELPYAEPDKKPETWAIDMVLEQAPDMPKDILDCIANFKEEAVQEVIDDYQEFRSELPSVIYDRNFAVCEDYTVVFPKNGSIKPESARGKLLLMKAARMWKVKGRPGVCRNIIIKYCIVCGRADCDYMPIKIVLTIKG